MPSDSSDPFQLERFVRAQQPVWEQVCAELRAGRKQSHWMWFVFPQLAALGRSAMARHYGLSGLEEARAYRAHPVLGPRLAGACAALLRVDSRSAEEIFGTVDAMKLRSCLTLFQKAGESGDGDRVLQQCLARFFDGQPDPLTLAQLQ